tara:strand:+ start:395 stop:499 length:105 start_codon:yes stop_codon:yes gene_type:complete
MLDQPSYSAQKKPTFAGWFVVVGWALDYGCQYPN